MKVVASLTTIPSRIDDECKRSIDSLLSQVDHIYLNVSKTYRRFQSQSIVIPDYLTQQEPYKSCVTVTVGEDYGSPSKYLGALHLILSQDVYVFICDDDQEYHPELISKMKSRITSKQYIYQNRYDIFKQYGTSGGLIHGFVGLLIHNSLLENLAVFPLPECARFIDDQWFSMYCKLYSYSIVSSGINDYSEIFQTLRHDAFELMGKDSLIDLGNRNEKIQELYAYFGGGAT